MPQQRPSQPPKLVELYATSTTIQSCSDREIPVVVPQPRYGCGGSKPGFANAVATALPIGPN